MDRAELIARLMATFREELEEHLRVFNKELLALEQAPSGPGAPESIKTLFRAAHSLKGAARSVDAATLEAICHRLEETLAAIRDGERALDAPVFQALFASVDELVAAGKQLGVDARPAPTPLPTRTPTAVPRSVREDSVQLADVDSIVRLPGRKLDALLAQSGEVLVARRRLEARRDELIALQDLVTRFRGEWREANRWWRRGRRARAGAPAAPVLQFATPGSAPMPARALRAWQNTHEYLARIERDLERFSAGWIEDGRALARVSAPLEEQIHDARLLVFAEACEGLQRVVRDLTVAQHKDAELVLEGAPIEIDRSIIDGLRDPLLHLVRNAIDHGIEPLTERLRRGKPGRAKLIVAAALRGEVVEITVSDDGRGLDLGAIRQQANAHGLALPSDEAELARLIFHPGFSTASTVTRVSGRGVGLDVVKSRIEAMRGHVDLHTDSAGTRFTLTLPLTLTTARVLLVRAGGEVLAFPSASVRRLLRAGPEDLRMVEGREMLLTGEAPVPLVALADALKLGVPAPTSTLTKVPIVLTGSADQQVALSVDEFLTEREVVLKPLGKRIGRMRYVAAATLLENGRIALLLKPAELVRHALGAARGAQLSTRFATATPKALQRLLLVDDSVTTRTLEKSILEAAGYEVLTAADGVAAWQVLQDKGADLVVSDVEMPNMDGIALTRTIRAAKRFHALPIVLLTALESAQDRARGLEAGADAYLVKSAFDQRTLLEAIRQLL